MQKVAYALPLMLILLSGFSSSSLYSSVFAQDYLDTSSDAKSLYADQLTPEEKQKMVEERKKETRQKEAERKEQVRQDIEEKKKQARENAAERKEQTKENLEERKQQAKEKLDAKRAELKEKARERLDTIKDNAQERKDAIKERVQERRAEIRDDDSGVRKDIVSHVLENREDLKEKFEDRKEQLKSELREKAQEKRSEIKEKVQEKRSEIKEKIQNKKDRIQEFRSTIKDRLSDRIHDKIPLDAREKIRENVLDKINDTVREDIRENVREQIRDKVDYRLHLIKSKINNLGEEKFKEIILEHKQQIRQEAKERIDSIRDKVRAPALVDQVDDGSYYGDIPELPEEEIINYVLTFEGDAFGASDESNVKLVSGDVNLELLRLGDSGATMKVIGGQIILEDPETGDLYNVHDVAFGKSRVGFEGSAMQLTINTSDVDEQPRTFTLRTTFDGVFPTELGDSVDISATDGKSKSGTVWILDFVGTLSVDDPVPLTELEDVEELAEIEDVVEESVEDCYDLTLADFYTDAELEGLSDEDLAELEADLITELCTEVSDEVEDDLSENAA